MLATLFVGDLPNEIARDDDYLISDSDLTSVNKDHFNFYNPRSITILNAFDIGKRLIT
jgi:hypothetical protein